jgi:hypothetical protein
MHGLGGPGEQGGDGSQDGDRDEREQAVREISSE